MMRIVLTGGVTGGHIYPAIAIGDRFREADPSTEIIYIASGHPLEREIIPAAGYELFEVDSEPFYRHDLKKLPMTAIRNIRGRSEARRIIREFGADALISTGSYVSVPAVLAAHSLKVPVYLHEQNGYPGISNRVMARFATRIFLGFESAADYFEDKSKIICSGNPVRMEFANRSRADDRAALGIADEELVILIFGGSQGSDTTNVMGEAFARKYAGTEGVTLIWGTGDRYYDEIVSGLDPKIKDANNIKIMPYITDMPLMLSVSDISVSRSGALSVAETAMAGRVAIFVPSPNVTEDHQYYNAKALADKGAAFIVREDGGADSAADHAIGIAEELIKDRAMIERMEAASKKEAPVNAAEIIYDNIINTYKQGCAKGRRAFGRG